MPGNVSLPIAFAAGLVSFLSPCVLPLVPAYLAYLGRRAAQPELAAAGVGPSLVGAPASRRSDLALSGIAFIAGVSLIFILFFYVFYTVFLRARPIVVPLAGVIVILFALQVAGVVRIPLLMREFRPFDRVPGQGGPAGGFVLGLSFATGWTPCIGPTLGAVITSGIAEGASAGGVLLMIAYCLGLGLPFLAMALAFERATPVVRALNRRRRVIDLASAAVLLLMGVLLLTNNLLWITQQLARLLPGLLVPLGL